jgi:hypothetical protein
VALDVPRAELLPTTPAVEDLAVTRQQARKLLDGLLESDDWAVLMLLARLAEATNG